MPLERRPELASKDVPTPGNPQHDVMRADFSRRPEPKEITAFSNILIASWASERDQHGPGPVSSPLHSLSFEQLRVMKSSLMGYSAQKIDENLGTLDDSIREKREEYRIVDPKDVNYRQRLIPTRPLWYNKEKAREGNGVKSFKSSKPFFCGRSQTADAHRFAPIVSTAVAYYLSSAC